jgi:hypothetical protein
MVVSGIGNTYKLICIHKVYFIGLQYKLLLIFTIQLNDVTSQLNQPSHSPYMDFSADSVYTDAQFKTFLGISRTNFEHVFFCIEGKLNCSVNRSSRDALAIFLMFLRAGGCQKLIGAHFGIEHQRVSEIISRVSDLLDTLFHFFLATGILHVSNFLHTTQTICQEFLLVQIVML